MELVIDLPLCNLDLLALNQYVLGKVPSPQMAPPHHPYHLHHLIQQGNAIQNPKMIECIILIHVERGDLCLAAFPFRPPCPHFWNHHHSCEIPLFDLEILLAKVMTTLWIDAVSWLL